MALNCHRCHLCALTVLLLALCQGVALNAAELDRYGGFKDIKGEKTGFFHTQKINGRQWLITPDGHGFFGIAMSHPVTTFSQGAVTFAYDGDQELWLRDGIRKMRAMGYNCVWSGPYSQERIRLGFVDRKLAERVYRESKMPHGLQIPILKHAVEYAKGEKREDVFSDDYAQFVKSQVQAFVPIYKDNPWLLGYYYSFAAFMVESTWVNDLLSYAPGSPGRERLLDVLEARYKSDIDLFNEVYKTGRQSFDEIRKKGGVKFKSRMRDAQYPKMAKDRKALIGEMAEHVYRLAYTEIRKIDQNHMILGSYVKDSTFNAQIWDRIAPYIDTLSPQHFSKTSPFKPYAERTGLPVMLSDQVFGNVCPGPLIGVRPGGAVPDHLDRRLLYELLAKRVGADADLIGVSFCAILHDNSHWSKVYDRVQPGFYTIDNVADQKLIAQVKSAHAMIYDAVRKPLDEARVAALDKEYHTINEHYQVIARQRAHYLRRIKQQEMKALLDARP